MSVATDCVVELRPDRLAVREMPVERPRTPPARRDLLERRIAAPFGHDGPASPSSDRGCVGRLCDAGSARRPSRTDGRIARDYVSECRLRARTEVKPLLREREAPRRARRPDRGCPQRPIRASARPPPADAPAGRRHGAAQQLRMAEPASTSAGRERTPARSSLHRHRFPRPDELRRLPAPRHAAVGPAADQRAGAPRRAAVHHPAPDHRAVAQARAARAAIGPRSDRADELRPRSSASPGSSTSSARSPSSGRCSPRSPPPSTPSSAASSATHPASSPTSTARSSSCSATRTPGCSGLRVGCRGHRPARRRSRRRASTTSSCATCPAGLRVPASVLERDVTEAWTFAARAGARFRAIYENPERALARLRDLRGVRRPRGQLPALAVPAPEDRAAHHRHEARHRRIERRGFLQKALELTFFPELFAVRTEIRADGCPRPPTACGSSADECWLGGSTAGPLASTRAVAVGVRRSRTAVTPASDPAPSLPALVDAHVHLAHRRARAARRAAIAESTTSAGIPIVARAWPRATACRAGRFAGAFLTAPGGYPVGRLGAARRARVVELSTHPAAGGAAQRSTAARARRERHQVHPQRGRRPGARRGDPARDRRPPTPADARHRAREGDGRRSPGVRGRRRPARPHPCTERLDDALLARGWRSGQPWVSTLDIHGWGDGDADRRRVATTSRRFHAARRPVLYGTDLGNGAAAGRRQRARAARPRTRGTARHRADRRAHDPSAAHRRSARGSDLRAGATARDDRRPARWLADRDASAHRGDLT